MPLNSERLAVRLLLRQVPFPLDENYVGLGNISMDEKCLIGDN